MSMNRAVLCLCAGLLTGQPAMATSTWCAAVRGDVPGGFLAMRGGPSASEPQIDRLPPLEELELESAPCALQLSDRRAIVGSVCRGSSNEWAFVEYVPSRNLDLSDVLEARRRGGGWVEVRHLQQHTCEWDKE